MQTQTANSPMKPGPNCLGCADCKGLCRDLYELTFIPELVLHRSAASP